MMNFIKSLIPRWTLDTVALQETHGSYEIVCIIEDVRPGETFDAVCDLRVFTWFLWSWPYGGPINLRAFTPKVNA